MLPIKNWAKPLRVGEVAIDRSRPLSDTGLVYVVGGNPAPDRDIKYCGSGHATKSVDGLARIGVLIAAMLGFRVYHSGGNKLYKAYPADRINNFYVVWAPIEGCPILEERELRQYYMNHPTESPDFKRLDSGEPKRNRVCNKTCIPQDLGWNEKP